MLDYKKISNKLLFNISIVFALLLGNYLSIPVLWLVLLIIAGIVVTELYQLSVVNEVTIVLAPHHAYNLHDYNHKKFKIIQPSFPEQLDTFAFDIVLIDPTYRYSPAWQSFFIHCSILNKRVMSLWEVEESYFKRISIRYLNDEFLYKALQTQSSYAFFKEALDIVLALTLIPFLIVPTFFISIAIKLNSSGPVLFKQLRLGKNGKSFVMYKFRSMQNVKGHGETLPNDPRITAAGKFLRKTRLDELPQIINVLKGEMSFIGPRPEAADLNQKHAQEINCYNLRLKVKPGITGWAQVNQGYSVGVDGSLIRICYDLFYIKHLSLFLDLKTFFFTLKTLITTKGAL